MKKVLLFITGVFVAGLVFSQPAFSQTPEFSYQGNLSNAGNPSNGNHDFEFALFDAQAGGLQFGSTNTLTNVDVVNGQFSVQLNFGGNFPGAARFLEIRVRQSGGGSFTTLTPRRQITSTPYSIQAFNATTADRANFATTATTAQNAASFTGSLAGDVSGTQGATVVIGVGGQTAANVAVATQLANAATSNNTPSTIVRRDASGGFSGGIVNASQYNFNGSPVLRMVASNIFVGVGAGTSNTLGLRNSFLGSNAGASNTTGNENTFVGFLAGNANNSGSENSFFGREAGADNTTGTSNSFFGHLAGSENSTGADNSYFGKSAGQNGTTGNSNAFFGRQAGEDNTTGTDNSFFGRSAGQLNTTGVDNSFFGRSAGGLTTTGQNNSFFGRDAGLFNTSGIGNSIFGRSAGRSNTSGGDNSFHGTAAGFGTTTGNNNSFFGRSAGDTNTTGSNNTVIGASADVSSNNLSFATALGAGALASSSNTVVLGRNSDVVVVPGEMQVSGTVRVLDLATLNPTFSLCYSQPGNQISFCSSARRFKTNINSYPSGLGLIKLLRPVSFNWKVGGIPDMGLVAEEVAEVEPLLVTTNASGEIQGVKYDRVGVVLINAVVEQQANIEAQQKQIDAQSQLINEQKVKLDIAEKQLNQQQAGLEALRTLVCSQNPTAKLCHSSEIRLQP